jgi:hypothetical protein
MNGVLKRFVIAALLGGAGIVVHAGVSLEEAHAVAIAGAAAAMILCTFFGTLLALHLDRESGKIALGIVARASRLLPPHARDQQCAEWADHVQTAGEHGLLPLSRALSIAAIAAPLLGIALRVGRSRVSAD